MSKLTNKPSTREEMAAFARNLAASCKDHESWLTLIRYGLATLLENQPLLIELIFREAVRLVKWSEVEAGYVPIEEVRAILTELGIRLEVC
jgi:hypothetical protein